MPVAAPPTATADASGAAPPATPKPRDPLGTAIRAAGLLLLLGLLALVALGILALASLLSVPNQVAGGLGQRLNSATSSAAQAVASAQQALQDATDPNHPPSGLVYDTEFSALLVWHTGDTLPGGQDYVLSVRSIERRQGAASPDTALYAVIHAELRQPHQTRLLGQVIRSDSDPHDYAIYKGESFRIGHSLYRVNWVSQADGTLAVGVYRNPDSVSATLKFAYD